jgi:Zn-dependent alcohol dehydrogenase
VTAVFNHTTCDIVSQFFKLIKQIWGLVSLVNAGLLSLDLYDTAEFKLDNINEALEYAAENSGAFKMTMVNP